MQRFSSLRSSKLIRLESGGLKLNRSLIEIIIYKIHYHTYQNFANSTACILYVELATYILAAFSKL